MRLSALSSSKSAILLTLYMMVCDQLRSLCLPSTKAQVCKRASKSIPLKNLARLNLHYFTALSIICPMKTLKTRRTSATTIMVV